MFFVAYTKDDVVADQARRPLSFVYNGGSRIDVEFYAHGPGATSRGAH